MTLNAQVLVSRPVSLFLYRPSVKTASVTVRVKVKDLKDPDGLKNIYGMERKFCHRRWFIVQVIFIMQDTALLTNRLSFKRTQHVILHATFGSCCVKRCDINCSVKPMTDQTIIEEVPNFKLRDRQKENYEIIR